LAEWLFALTTEEFQAASSGHVAMGHGSRDLEGGIVTVEKIAGTLLVSNHREEVALPDRIRFGSAATEAYSLLACSRRLELIWDLTIRPLGPAASELHSTVELRDRGRPAGRVLGMTGLSRGLRCHVAEETRGFAADILGKYRRDGAAED
jgi:hypothetical protein